VLPQLQYHTLNLSGCDAVTDEGLRAVSNICALKSWTSATAPR
jgi:hypothetical protein